MYVVIYGLLAALVGLCGRRRRVGFLGFFLVSLLLTPLVGLLVVYLTGERPLADGTSPPRS